MRWLFDSCLELNELTYNIDMLTLTPKFNIFTDLGRHHRPASQYLLTHTGE